jgi:DNA-binding NarL/FixJ family response regulator
MSAPAPGHGPVRILIVDDQRLVREGLRTLLDLQPDLEVVAQAADGQEAEARIAEHRPDVVLMDLRMPRRDGVAATRGIATRWPDVRVLVLTTFDDDELVFRALAAGAAGYLLKDIGGDALADAVRAAARGESPLQPSVARAVIERMRRDHVAPLPLAERSLPSFEPLSDREQQILGLLGGGASNREIAERLSLTEGTVKNYVSAILAKTGLGDRTRAALYAVRRGLT